MRASGRRIAPLLVAGLLSVHVTSEVASAKTFTPVADTHVRADARSTNYATAKSLRVDGSPTSRAYLRFNLRGSGPVIKATLRLYPQSTASSKGITASAVGRGRWREKTVTYSNSPPVGTAAGRTGAFSAGQWISIDVTPVVKGDRPVSLAVTTTSESSRHLASRESITRPRLLVESKPTPSSVPPPPVSPPSPPSAGIQPSFPVRAAFYYPWFPETTFGHYVPEPLGFYNSSDPAVVDQHIRALDYAKVEAGIASWWSPGKHQEQTRIPLLLNRTRALGSRLKWALYYECEGPASPSCIDGANPPVAELQKDLAYASAYTVHPSYLRVNGKPVIFVYSATDTTCEVADRWKQAAPGWHVVLKLFSGFRDCASQPDGWHQYGPSTATQQHTGYSYVISPGFWKHGETTPRLSRDLNRWRQQITEMIASGEPWQLITTFNEWGEGTAVESAGNWASASKKGAYLDALATDGR